MRISYLLFSASIIFTLLFPGIVKAQSSENSMYKIQIENINSFADPTESNNINVDNPNAGNELEGLNYKIDLGQDYSPSYNAFAFSISNLNIDFGSLSPTNPVIRSSTLRVKNIKKAGYKVTSTENHELTEAKSGARIPDTTCDDGKCTQMISSKWESTLAYGFGYRCDSSKPNCVENDNSFAEKSFYKQFADLSSEEAPITILSEGSSFGQEAVISYKVNIPSSQPKGAYSNIVTFIAIPNY